VEGDEEAGPDPAQGHGQYVLGRIEQASHVTKPSRHLPCSSRQVFRKVLDFSLAGLLSPMSRIATPAVAYMSHLGDHGQRREQLRMGPHLMHV
jgi:hypothetical protein